MSKIASASGAGSAAGLAVGAGELTSIGQRFLRACEDGEAIAVRARDGSLTYRQVAERSEAIARALISLQLPAGSPIPILSEKEPELVCIHLGVARAGLCAVPLDPHFPPSAIQEVLRDTGAPWVIAAKGLADLAADLVDHRCQVIDLAAPLTEWSGQLPEIDSSARAYMIYTSGSTGRPKGVVHTHASALHNALNYTQNLELTAGDVLLMTHAVSSASALVDLYCAVLNGACVALWDIRRDGLSGLADFTARANVSVSMMVPTLYRQWIENVPAGALNSLRVIGLGGERIAPSDVELFRRQAGAQCTLVVRMGTSETNNYALHRISHDHPASADLIPVGRASCDKEILIVDEARQPLPAGTVGEIVVRSPYMAEGYWGLPDVTAEKFSNDGDFRLYYTGDMGHVDENGVLWFKGRADDQVQIHGHRVELATVETALASFPGVEVAVVVVVRDTRRAALVAYCEVRDGTQAADLRQFVAEKLPLHERPSHYQFLDALPMSAAQKVDRRALQALGIPQSEARLEDETSWTNDERSLGKIWREVMHLEAVGLDEDFFALGGHSLSVAQVIARVETTMNRSLTFERFFATPTLRALAKYLTEDAPPAEIPPDSLLTIDASEPAPLSWAQWRLWYINQLGMGSAAYNLRWVTDVEGELNVPVLEEALSLLYQRHEVLRTSFAVDDDGVPEQVVHDVELSIDHFDLTGLSRTEQYAAAMRQVNDHTTQPFDLERGPLTRVALVKLAHDQYVLSFVTHHTVADGWSADIQRRELALIYSDLLASRPNSLSELPVQYANFARWQRRFVGGDVMQRQETYWHSRLNGQLPQLQLPLDRVRPPLFTYRGYSIIQKFSLSTVDKLARFGAQNDATLFMTLLTAWFVLLSRYSGQTDILVGSPMANRRRPELEGMIGFFANSLIIRGEFDKKTSFVDLLAHVRQRATEAFDHQDMPFEKLVEDLITERDLSTTPMFQNLFIYQDTPLSEINSSGVRWKTAYPSHRSAKTEIGAICFNKPDGLEVHWEFCVDLFEESTVRQMSEHFATLIDSALADPQRSIFELSMISRHEAKAIEAVNATERLPLPSPSLHELIREQARRTPSATATQDSRSSQTYRELDEQSDRVAFALVAQGVKLGDYVGVCVARTCQLPAILLGVLKAGAAYVPMDPEYPKSRLGIMVDVAAPSVILTDRSTLDRVPEGALAIVVFEDVAEQARQALPAVTESHLAYAIFTSGSTGKPKGVEIPHRAIVNLVRSVAERPGLDADDRLLAVTTLSFDIAALELFAPLIVGATVHVANEKESRDGLALNALLRDSEISVLQATPATWRLLIAAGWEGGEGLKALCGGEALPPELVPDLVDRVGSLWNMYGPTETTVWSTCHQLESLDADVLIGRPFDNTTVHVLDESKRVQPMNLPGELYIGGLGLAKGYASRPDLTAERFVDWTSPEGERQRLYRTGDRVRLRATGALEYLHRLDDQIKLRGFRIEPREIEAVLSSHPDVAGCAASVLDRGNGDQRLIGWVVPTPGTDPSFVALSKHLRAHVPDYMVPQHWQLLEQLPLTLNGKLDRQGLPEVESMGHARSARYEAPRTEVEQAIAQVWQRAIDLDQVGLHDRFFEIGGHSLLSLQVIHKLRNEHGIVVTPRAMLTESVESLAAGAELTEAPLKQDASTPEKRTLRDRLGSILRR